MPPLQLLTVGPMLPVLVAVLVKANAVAQPPTAATRPPKPAEEDEVAATAREAAREQRGEGAARRLLLFLIFACMGRNVGLLV